jgi:serine phosphatase RsbU (regulator of sigma subunit)
MQSHLKYIIVLLFVWFKFSAQDIDSLKHKIESQTDTTLFKSILNLGNTYYKSGQLDSAISNFSFGLLKSKQAANNKFVCTFLIKLGTMNREKGIYNVSSQLFYEALIMAEKNDFKLLKANCYNGIAIISTVQKDYVKAIDSYNKSLAIYQKSNNLSGIGSVYNNLGLVYLNQKNNAIALEFFFKALKINNNISNDFGIAASCENIGLIYNNKGNYKLALVYFSTALNLWYSHQDDNSISVNLGYIGNSLNLQKQFLRAIDTLKRGLNFASIANSQASKRENMFYLSQAYEGLNDYKNSFLYYKLANEITDSIQNNEKTKQITEIQLSYGFNQQKMQDSIKHQLEVQVKENQLSTEKNYKYIISSVLLIILALLFFVYKNYNEKNKANIIITEQKKQVENKNLIIGSKQKEIVDSINYARRIQFAQLASHEILSKNLSEHFVFFAPKDIVSGDFYWATEHNQKFYLAVCDCTGHGVSGAFMSLLSIGFLNEAIKDRGILEPNQVFNYVRDRFIDSKSENNYHDGFDGILFCYDKIARSISYSAANNGPLLVRNNELIELKKDKMPVAKTDKMDGFSNYSIDIQSGDMLYLFSDGFADQFGGELNKKFKYKTFINLLHSNSLLAMNEQLQKLNTEFNTWKGDLEQVDDICVLGFKI